MEISRYKIKAENVKSIKFVFVSDLHDCENNPIISVIKSEKPDAVLISGDVINGEDSYEKGMEFLSLSSALCRTFCSVGNHDILDNFKEFAEKYGAKVLDNEYTVFNGIYLGGLSSGFTKGIKQGKFLNTPPPDISWLKRFSELNGYKILLSHHPEYYPQYIKELPIDLTLSGHAHGGQWRVFGRGLFAPGQGLFPKYISGMYEDRLIVSRGLGNHTIIPRIFNKTQINIIEINQRRK